MKVVGNSESKVESVPSGPSSRPRAGGKILHLEETEGKRRENQRPELARCEASVPAAQWTVKEVERADSVYLSNEAENPSTSPGSVEGRHGVKEKSSVRGRCRVREGRRETLSGGGNFEGVDGGAPLYLQKKLGGG